MLIRGKNSGVSYLSDYLTLTLTDASGAVSGFSFDNYMVRGTVDFADGMGTEVYITENGNATSIGQKNPVYIRFNLRVQESQAARRAYHLLRDITQEKYGLSVVMKNFISPLSDIPINDSTGASNGDLQQIELEFTGAVVKLVDTPADRIARGLGTVSNEVEVIIYRSEAYEFPPTQPIMLLGSDESGIFVPEVEAEFIGVLPAQGVVEFEMQLTDSGGTAIAAGAGNYVYLRFFDTAVPATILCEIYAPVGCNLFAATVLSSDPLDAPTLAGNQIIEISGFSAAGEMQDHIVSGFATVAHNGSIRVDKLGWMNDQGYICYGPEDTTTIYIEITGILTTADEGSSSEATGYIAEYSLDEELNEPKKIYYADNGRIFIADENNRKVRVIDPGNVVKTVQTDSTEISCVHAWENDPVADGNPSIIYAPNTDHTQITAPNLAGVECLEVTNWSAPANISSTAPTINYAVFADPIATRYKNGYPIIWRCRGRGGYIDFDYYNGAAWVAGGSPFFNATDLKGVSLFDFGDCCVDSQGRIYGVVTRAVGRATYNAASPTDPAVWVNGNFLKACLAGRTDTAGDVDGDGTAARFTGLRGLCIMEQNYNATGHPRLMLFDGTQHVIKILYHNGGVSVTESDNWEVETVAGVGGTSGDVLGTGAAARFNQPYAGYYDGSQWVYFCDAINDKVKRIKANTWEVELVSGTVQGDTDTVTF